MVEVAGHIALIAFKMGLLKLRKFSERLFAIAHAVALKVGLGHNV